MELYVPGAKSLLSFPATVTRPGFTGCSNRRTCRGHRLAYRVTGDVLEIAQGRFHG
jgi:hypothetical protein